jgi:hypothetical protein
MVRSELNIGTTTPTMALSCITRAFTFSTRVGNPGYSSIAIITAL